MVYSEVSEGNVEKFVENVEKIDDISLLMQINRIFLRICAENVEKAEAEEGALKNFSLIQVPFFQINVCFSPSISSFFN